jgi:hypothetical protein
MAEIARLKQDRLNHDARYCWRHPEVSVQERCIGCQEGICEFCTYHPVGGVFRKRIDRIPLCFSCVRGKIGYKIRHCIVKHLAAEPDWSRKVF